MTTTLELSAAILYKVSTVVSLLFMNLKNFFSHLMVFSGKNKFPSEPVVAIVQTTIGRNIA